MRKTVLSISGHGSKLNNGPWSYRVLNPVSYNCYLVQEKYLCRWQGCNVWNKPEWKYGKSSWISQLSLKLLTSLNVRSYMFLLFVPWIFWLDILLLATKGILIDTGLSKRLGQSQLRSSSGYWGRTCPTCLPWEQSVKCGEWRAPIWVGSRADNSGESHKVKKMFREEVLRIGAFVHYTTGFFRGQLKCFWRQGRSGSCS